MYQKYIAETVGTFALATAILGAVSFTGVLPMAIPLIAGFTLGLFVYTIGAISGCHINPAVTLGLMSVRKISRVEGVRYIVAQIVGAVCAIIIAKIFFVVTPLVVAPFEVRIFIAEMIGTFFFTFGIASVVYGKAKEQMSGFVIGGSLLFGILIASFLGASGILNPAVAFTLNSLTFVYLFAPILGSVLGFQVYRYLVDGR